MPLGPTLPPSSLQKNTITVHLHSKDNPNLVLKRRGGRLVLGPPDANSDWSLEQSWEYYDYLTPEDPYKPGPYIDRGPIYVIKSPREFKFLAARGGGVGLTTEVEAVRAHWRIARYNTGSAQACIPDTFQDREPLIADTPPPPMDMEMVNKLADWVLEQYVNSQPNVCWKPGGKGDCKDLDRVRTVECGLACTKTTRQCVEDVVNKVKAVGEMVASIASLVGTAGVGSAIKSATSAAVKTGTKMGMKFAAKLAVKIAGRILKKALKDMRRSLGAYVRKRMVRAAKENGQILTREGIRVASELSQTQKQRHEDRMVDEILARAGQRIYLASKPDIGKEILDAVEAIDPTGVVGVINAFNQPECGNIPMPK